MSLVLGANYRKAGSRCCGEAESVFCRVASASVPDVRCGCVRRGAGGRCAVVEAQARSRMENRFVQYQLSHVFCLPDKVASELSCDAARLLRCESEVTA